MNRPVFGRAATTPSQPAATAAPVDAGERFIAMVALAEPGNSEFAALKRIFETEFAGTSMKIEEFASRGAKRELGGLLLRIDGVVITVLSVPQPIPASELDEPIRHAKMLWTDASSALSRHRAHLIVATLNPCSGHGPTLDGAAYVTFVTAALARLNGAATLGVYWASGRVVVSPELFLAAAASVAQRQVMPEIWVRLDFVRGGKAPSGHELTGMTTTGLAPFCGHELLFDPTDMPPSEVGRRVYFVARYLIERGPVIRDGETLGLSEREKIRASLRRDPSAGGAPAVMRLTLETPATSSAR